MFTTSAPLLHGTSAAVSVVCPTHVAFRIRLRIHGMDAIEGTANLSIDLRLRLVMHVPDLIQPSFTIDWRLKILEMHFFDRDLCSMESCQRDDFALP